MTPRQRLATMVASRTSYHSDNVTLNAVTEEIAYNFGGKYKTLYDNMTKRSWQLFITQIRKHQPIGNINGRWSV